MSDPVRYMAFYGHVVVAVVKRKLSQIPYLDGKRDIMTIIINVQVF